MSKENLNDTPKKKYTFTITNFIRIMYKQNKWLLNFRVDCGHMVFLIKIAVLNGK